MSNDSGVPFFEQDPHEIHQQQADREDKLGATSPSLVLGLPKLLIHAVVAGAITHFAPVYRVELQWVAQQVADAMGDAFPYQTWYYWFLAMVWLVVMAPAVWRLLALLTTRFEFTTQRVYYARGVLNRQRDQLEISRIRDLSTNSPFWQRPFGLGALVMDTVDRSHPELVIPGSGKSTP